MGRQCDLPVTVELNGTLAQEVSAYVECEAGWQLVSVEGPPRPVLVLTDRARRGLPCVVVVDGTPSMAATRSALLDGALDVIGWPQDRARLLDLPRHSAPAPHAGGGPALLRVGGAAGGVGTSTVALALAGLLAWEGRRTVVVGDEDLLALCGLAPWSGPGVREVAALHPADVGKEVQTLARAVPGMRGLTVLGGGGAAVAAVSDWPGAAVLVDVRAAGATADLVVARPDASLRGAATCAAPVLVVGDGPLDRRGVQRMLGRAPVAWLPASARVARAGLLGRVPASLPGTWMAALRPVFATLARAPR